MTIYSVVKVKSGGATEELGTKITLHLTDVSDMSRDLLKVAPSIVLPVYLAFTSFLLLYHCISLVPGLFVFFPTPLLPLSSQTIHTPGIMN